jgi:hypothetical protein
MADDDPSRRDDGHTGVYQIVVEELTAYTGICRVTFGDIRCAQRKLVQAHYSSFTIARALMTRTAQHLQHAHELMAAHPLIDSHVDLPYVMRAVRECLLLTTR